MKDFLGKKDEGHRMKDYFVRVRRRPRLLNWMKDERRRMKDLLPSSLRFQSRHYLVFHLLSLLLHPQNYLVFHPLSLILHPKMADGYLESHYVEYEKKKAAWLKRKNKFVPRPNPMKDEVM